MNDVKTKIFWIIVILFFVGSVSYSYWRFVVARDFVIVMHTPCDPFEERCFVEYCDPEASGDDEWVCVGDEEEDISYYKIQKRRAAHVPLCDPADEQCDAFVCGKNESECQTIYCGDPEAEENGECVNPTAYRGEHPENEDANDVSDESLGDEEEEDAVNATDAQDDESNATPVF